MGKFKADMGLSTGNSDLGTLFPVLLRLWWAFVLDLHGSMICRTRVPPPGRWSVILMPSLRHLVYNYLFFQLFGECPLIRGNVPIVGCGPGYMALNGS